MTNRRHFSRLQLNGHYVPDDTAQKELSMRYGRLILESSKLTEFLETKKNMHSNFVFYKLTFGFVILFSLFIFCAEDNVSFPYLQVA